LNIQPLLPLPVVLPIAGAVTAPLLSRWHRRLPLIVAIITMLAAMGVLAVIARQVYGGSGHLVSEYLSGEHPFSGKALGIALVAGPFGMAFALLTATLGLLLLVSALSELGDLGQRELGVLACLMQLLLAALIGSALTADTVNLFVWFEVAALASYGLTGFFLEQPTALEAAFKVLVLTSIAGFLVFMGSAILYRAAGGLNLGQLHHAAALMNGTPGQVGVGLLLAGFATKAGLVPFHTWLPDAHAQGPSAVSALFSALMVDLGIVAIARISLQMLGAEEGRHALVLLTWAGMVSALLGALMALVQDDLKRLLAWDTVSQCGVLVVGFASAKAEGVAGAVYHLLNHGLFKALLFLCAGAILHATGTARLSEMGGLARRRPFITAGFTVGALAISGVPPLNGFASLGLIHKGIEDDPVIHVLAIVAQIITVAALGRATYLGFYRRRQQPYEHLAPSHAGMRFSLVALGAGCAAFGALPGVLIDHVAAPAASILLHPGTFAEGTLKGAAVVPKLTVSFSYTSVSDLIMSAVEIVLGGLLALLVVRHGEPRPVTWIRRLHSGSVNDYVAFAVVGMIVYCGALLG